MAECYLYRSAGKGDVTLFSVEDHNAEDYRALKDQIGQFGMLYLARNYHVHPFGHKEDKKELDARTNFRIEDWHLIAAVYDPSHRDGFSSALLVHKEDPHRGIVIEMTGLQVTDLIYGEWAIEDEAGKESMDEVLDFAGVHPVFSPSPAPRKKEEAVVAPSFTPVKKGKVNAIILEEDKKLFQAILAPGDEDDEDEDVAPKNIAIERPSFTANSSKKPKNLDVRISAKKPQNPIEKPKEKPLETPSAPSFAPVSNKKPINLNQSRSRWQAVPKIRFFPDRKVRLAQTIIANPNDARSMSILEGVEKRVGELKDLYIADNCCFAPEIPETAAWRQKIKAFHLEEWNLLSANVDSYNQPLAVVLSLKEEPSFCVVLRMGGKVISVGFNGVVIQTPYVPFEELLRLREEPKPEPAVEEKPKPEPKPEPKKEAIPVVQEEEAPLKELRRVFVTNTFAKAQERFTRKYHAAAENDFDQLIRGLLTMDEDALVAYLRAHDAKPIHSENGVTILKMRFGSSAEYEAARLFYCRGYDLRRRMDSSDFLLLGFTDQGEHEEQTQTAQLFARMFRQENDLVLYRKLLPVRQGEALDQLAYMSRKQFAYLESAKQEMPMAFLGSAGTGKTLLSLQHYCSLLQEGKKVLYLTYQKALCDAVRKSLAELGASAVEAMTYRDLCFAIFGEEKAKEMRTKKRFRNWFYNYVQKTGSAKAKLRAVGPTIEDQFMICYVFYRGIIDGARADWQKRRGAILSREQFLAKVRNEKGFSLEAKQAVYDLAIAYEKHLERHQGTTDNKLASEILALGKKAQRYDAIVIDEFQDLSELQFMAVVSLLRPTFPLPLFIYGDENQAINPTIFGFSDAQDILFHMFGKTAKFQRTALTDSFRSGPNLVHYINDVNRVKRHAIGARSKVEEVEVSLREDEEDLFATLLEGKENLNPLVDICARSDKDVVFLFPTALRKQEAERAFSSLAPAFAKSSFLSVEEAKGREWDSVVLVDFFSSSKELFDAMLGQERVGHQSTIHRMLFNRFYVALTRAENRIVVFETDVSPRIRENLLSGLTPLRNVEALQEYFRGDVEGEKWQEFGEKLFASRRYGAAYKAFSRLQGEEAEHWASLSLRYLQAEQEELDYASCRDLYLSQLDEEKLRALYEEYGRADHLRFLDAVSPSGDVNYALEIYQGIDETLSTLEKRVFFSLLAHKLKTHIDALEDKLSSIAH